MISLTPTAAGQPVVPTSATLIVAPFLEQRHDFSRTTFRRIGDLYGIYTPGGFLCAVLPLYATCAEAMAEVDRYVAERERLSAIEQFARVAKIAAERGDKETPHDPNYSPLGLAFEL